MLLNPCWPSSPPVCERAHLLAFSSIKEAYAWHERNSPRCSMETPFECPWCNQFHYQSTAPDPAGNSSGTGRHSKHRK